jgi:hypothetical protein
MEESERSLSKHNIQKEKKINLEMRKWFAKILTLCEITLEEIFKERLKKFFVHGDFFIFKINKVFS